MSTKTKKTVGVIGGSGYTGGELIRLLVNHPEISIDFVYSTTRPGTYLTDTHNDLIGQTDLQFTNEINPDVDVLFLCLGHGLSGSFLQENPMND
ncbi:MAG: N-acetyl-gamma-glutamyl-phosphate reductase, partial [Bacteroidota bacterium]|nr:N-acetyl-gamma-glutamyl-phosphate reductase [Bacteroidota bacterium]